MQIFTVMKGISLDSLETFAAVEILAIIFLRLLQLSKTLFYLFWRRRKFKNRIDETRCTIKWVQFYYFERENYIYKRKNILSIYSLTWIHPSSSNIWMFRLKFLNWRFVFSPPFLFSNSCTIMHLLSSAMRSTMFEAPIFKHQLQRILNNQWLKK